MNEIPLPANQSHILHHLYRWKKPARLGELKNQMLSSGSSYAEITQPLFEGGYIALNDNMVSLTAAGLQYMAAAEQEETERIQRLVFEDEFDLAVLALLSYRNTWVSIEDVPELLKEHAPKYGGAINDGPFIQAAFQLCNKGYIKEHYVHWYEITTSGKAFYRYQIKKFERNENASGVAGVFSIGAVSNLTVNQVSGGNNQGANFGSTSTQYVGAAEDPATKELTKKQLEDFPKQKLNRKWVTILTIIGLILTGLGIYLGLTGQL